MTVKRCESKALYPNARVARQYLHDIRMRGNRDYKPRNAYFCAYHDGYHLTHLSADELIALGGNAKDIA